jgi:hypothetical protein
MSIQKFAFTLQIIDYAVKINTLLEDVGFWQASKIIYNGITIVVDTNMWVSFVMGHSLDALLNAIETKKV